MARQTNRNQSSVKPELVDRLPDEKESRDDVAASDTSPQYVDPFPLVNFDGYERKSKFINLVGGWSSCRLCPLATTRSNVVFVRGAMPCDVLFLGQAPGADDDATGLPLSGRSGMLLDRLVADVASRAYDDDKETPKLPLSYCIALTVGCVPWGCGDNLQYRHPSSAEEKACLPRLASLLELAEPKSIILLGDTVKQYWTRNEKYFREFVSYLPDARTIARIPAPATIIAKGGSSEGNDAYREARSAIRNIVLNRVLKPR